MDVLAHFLVGGLIGWMAFMIAGSRRKSVIIIWTLALFKEFFIDLQGANILDFSEVIKDVFFSIVGAYGALYLSDAIARNASKKF